jgi:hypothetical protein
MERRYIGVQTVGQPRRTLETISRVVRNHNLASTIPVIKVEKRARGQFYVFIAVEGLQTTDIPQSVITVFREAGLRGRLTPPLELSQISFMVSGSEIETEGVGSLAYKSRWIDELEDPFDLFTEDATDVKEEDMEIGNRYEKLLYWLSASGEGTWGTFHHACETLELINDQTSARSILRRLMLLGHLECSTDGRHWTICRPTLIRSPVDPGISLLSGARYPGLLEELKTKWNLEELSQPLRQGPACIRVACGDLAEDKEVDMRGRHSMFMAGVSSAKLAQALPDIEGWMNTLPSVDRLSTTEFEIERWNGDEYVPWHEPTEKDNKYIGKSGMYRLTRGEGTSSYSLNLFLDLASQRWLKGEWYGLAFLARHSAHIECKASYDKRRGILMIPNSSHLPMVYERSIVLATGQLPSHSDDKSWSKYESVSEELTTMLVNKLHFQIEERTNV